MAPHSGRDHSNDQLDFHSINLSFVVAIAANLLFTIFEAIYALLANSMSLLGDAGHNLSDVLGLLLAWSAAYLVTKKASQIYSYGYRRATILTAIINSIVLAFVAGYIAVESIERFFTPSPVAEIAIMVVAGIGILVNAGTALLFAKNSKSDLNLRGAFLHLTYDAAISAGVVVAAILIYFTGWLWVDPTIGLLIVAVIVGGTWGLLRDSVNLILDAVPKGINRQRVQNFLMSIEGVSQVHDLHIWAMSTNENCLTAHLVMPEKTLWDSESGYSEIGQSLKKQFDIHHVTLQVEKDLECNFQDYD